MGCKWGCSENELMIDRYCPLHVVLHSRFGRLGALRVQLSGIGNTDKTSLKADREDWGAGGSLKPPQNTGNTNANGKIGTGGPAAPREPAKSHKSFQNHRKPY